MNNSHPEYSGVSLDPSPTPLIQHVLVADSGRARLLRLSGPRRRPGIEQEAVYERASAHVPAHELTTDISGRVFESSGRGHTGATHTRHGANSDYDPHVVEIERFVARIAADLEARHRARALSNLILIAEPRLLGVLRARLPDDIRRLVTREVPGDYTHADNAAVLRVLESPVDR